MKQPFFIRPRGGEGIFVFAGLHSTWAGPEGELATCTIITTTPNDLMVSIHNRMPVNLSPGDQEAWLDPDNRHAESLLHPCPAEEMETYPVSAFSGNPRNDGPELINPLAGMIDC